jgi:prepilin-type N-terminal cleavage/methylation domain-containing protein
MAIGNRSLPLLRSGVTLLEMLVVLFIVSALLALLLPAVQSARESGRTAACQNNLRQMDLAVQGFANAHDNLPAPAAPGSAGGWTIGILPFMEQRALAEEIERNPSPAPGAFSPLARWRPSVFTCPSVDAEQSQIPGIPVAHYVLDTDSSRTSWRIADAPPGLGLPWVVGPEVASGYEHSLRGPHRGGYNVADFDRRVRFVPGP